MTVEKTVEALRCCSIGGDGCAGCPYNGLPDCDTRLYGDAADAIETLLFELDQWKQAWRTCYELRKEDLKNEQKIID